MTVLHGDCLEILRTLPDDSCDSLVTDPPAGINFMGKGWDADKGGRDYWIGWLASVMRESRRVLKPGAHALVWAIPRTSHWTALAIENAGFELRDCVYHIQGQGFPKSKNIGNGMGSALKPAVECWWLARKPCSEKTIEANYKKWGTGALNIDGCRIGTEVRHNPSASNKDREKWRMNTSESAGRSAIGRFPSHLILDEEAAAAVGDKARYFYCAKASKSDRGEGNTHATVKSTRLMSYLVRLVTPPSGTVLDPFMGSGSTCVAAAAEGMQFIGIEKEAEYFAIAQSRLSGAL